MNTLTELKNVKKAVFHVCPEDIPAIEHYLSRKQSTFRVDIHHNKRNFFDKIKQLITVIFIMLSCPVFSQNTIDIERQVARNNQITTLLTIGGAASIVYGSLHDFDIAYEQTRPEHEQGIKRAFIASGIISIITGAAIRHHTMKMQRLDYDMAGAGFKLTYKF